MGNKDELKPPRRTAGDVGHSVAKAAIGSLPYAGAAASELFAAFIAPPLERRRNEWMDEVGRRLQQIESRGQVNLEALQGDDRFIDTVMQASHIAMRNSQEEKRRALLNAVENSALEATPDDADQAMFLSLIDRLTPWHLRILDFFHDPPGWFDRNGQPQPEYGLSSSLDQALTDAYPELKGRREFYAQVCAELDADGLLKGGGSLQTMMSADGWKSGRASERGKAFLQFIAEPKRTEA